MNLNTPNKLTLLRVLMTPIFLAVILCRSLPHRYLIACIIFSAASITDAIDGNLARKNNQITNFGKFLDPIADKILTTAALLAFMAEGLCNVWIVMLVLTREFTVASIRMISASGGVVIPANIWGKIKTVTQMTFTIIIMLAAEGYYIAEINFSDVFSKLPSLSAVSNGMLWITAVFTVISGIIYIKDSVKVIDFSK